VSDAREGALVTTIGPRPEAWGTWLRELWDHRSLAMVLARKDFQTRYKRASLGLTWAVATPLLQALVLSFVFSRVTAFDIGGGYGAFVFAGITGWTYLSATLTSGTTSVVDGSGLADKVWFPRSVLVAAPALANVIGLLVSIVILVALTGVLDGELGTDLVLLVPAVALVVGLALGSSLVLSALYVYFRDVKFMVQTALFVLFYATPIVYPASISPLEGWGDLNPATGVVGLFQDAVTQVDVTGRAVGFSVAWTVGLLVVGLAVQHHYDRLFVDKL
jgi:ABC-2 type transport system permease protein